MEEFEYEGDALSSMRNQHGYSIEIEHSISENGKIGTFSGRGEATIDFDQIKPAIVFPAKLVLNEKQRAAFKVII